MMEKIFLVEDEITLLENLEILLTRNGYEVIGKEVNGDHLFFNNNWMDANLLIIDIMIEGSSSGIEVAKKIRESSKCPIVFLTALSDSTTLEKVSEIEQSSFILKPFTKDGLLTTLQLALLKTRGNNEKTIIKIRDKGHQVNLQEDEILILKADGLYTKIITERRQFIVREILKEVVDKLSSDKFLRVHKSFIINLDKINSFNSKEVILGEHAVPLRRGFFREFQKIVDRRMTNQ